MASSGGRRENGWGISCEKSRFYAKKIIFFSNFRGGGAPGAPPPGSAPGDVSDLANQCKDVPTGQRVMAMAFNATFNTFRNIVAVNFIGGGNRSIRGKLPTCPQVADKLDQTMLYRVHLA